MKLILSRRSTNTARSVARKAANGDTNEFLRLAREISIDDGDWPSVDMTRSQIRHWNGQAVAVARRDIDNAVVRGLLDRKGRWTGAGKRYLAGDRVVVGKAAS